MNIEIAHEISHLSAIEIEELYSKYLSGEKIAALIEFYNIEAHPNKLFYLFPPIEHENKLCPNCEANLYSKRKSKTENKQPDLIRLFECHTCQHKEYDGGHLGLECLCELCQAERKEHEKSRLQSAKEIVADAYSVDKITLYPYSDLAFKQKLFLLTMLRMQTDEDFEYIQSINDPRKTGNLSPTQEMDLVILRDLYNSNILLVDPESNINAFSEADNFNTFYIDSVRWVVNLTFDGATRASISEAFHFIYNEFLSEIKPEWKDEVHAFTFQLAQEEVIQFLTVKAEELNVTLSADKKTREVVTELLDSFSVSEIYYFIKNAVEGAHLFYSKGYSKGKTHAANTIPGKLLGLGERAKAEKWDTYRYNRDSRAPRSAVSKVFYELLLQGDDEGFSHAPGTYWEQELLPRYWPTKKKVSNKVACQACGSTVINLTMIDDVIVVTCSDCDVAIKYSRQLKNY